MCGTDERGEQLREKFDSAVARFSSLWSHPDRTWQEAYRIHCGWISLLGIKDQIQATINDRITELERGTKC